MLVTIFVQIPQGNYEPFTYSTNFKFQVDGLMPTAEVSTKQLVVLPTKSITTKPVSQQIQTRSSVAVSPSAPYQTRSSAIVPMKAPMPVRTSAAPARPSPAPVRPPPAPVIEEPEQNDKVCRRNSPNIDAVVSQERTSRICVISICYRAHQQRKRCSE